MISCDTLHIPLVFGSRVGMPLMCDGRNGLLSPCNRGHCCNYEHKVGGVTLHHNDITYAHLMSLQILWGNSLATEFTR